MLRHITIRIGSLLVALGLITGVVQTVLWLMKGYWAPWRLSLFWQYAGGTAQHAPPPGAGRLADWVLGCPLSFCFVLAGIIAWLVGTLVWSAFARG